METEASEKLINCEGWGGKCKNNAQFGGKCLFCHPACVVVLR